MTTPPVTPTVYIDGAGIHAPPFADVVSYFEAQFIGVYGDDTYLGNDAQDLQWLSIVAQAVADCNSSAVAAYLSRGPDGAQGVGLSSIVKINGIRRATPTASTAEVTIVGQAGIPINNGVVRDDNGFLWSLPASVTIPSSGTITVTATCQTLGAVQGGDDSITEIATPTFGWQTVTNDDAITPGAPVENDAQLRIRQAESTMIPAQTLLESLTAQLLALSGVTNVTPYENETDIPDANGLPGNCICMVVTGGDDQLIANTIQIGKGLGVNTYGSSSADYTYSWGLVRQVNFQRPIYVPIYVVIYVTPRAGYSNNFTVQIQNAIAEWIDGLGDGVSVEVTALQVPAYLNSPTQPKQYRVNQILISDVSSSDVAGADVFLTFIQRATCVVANVQVLPGVGP